MNAQDRFPKTTRTLRRNIERMGRSVQNALEILRQGRLGAPYHAAYEVTQETLAFNLRHYRPSVDASPVKGPPLLLVPPLMVSSEIYDISPELSAVQTLMEQGLDVWLVDYGEPEEAEDGMERTLDDHILAVKEAVESIASHTGQSVHLAGYSQGGMFIYQAAAYMRSKSIASLVTFGSPVDIWRNLPGVHEALTRRVLIGAQKALEKPLQNLPGLPGALTSNGFKILNIRKELSQLTNLFGLLHDREALEAREPKRRFLGGDGFVSWPGPALRDLIEQVVVDNRMASGGMVIDGRSVTLADITVPVLCFIGARDDMVMPPAVRAIVKAAPKAEITEVLVPTGHFGLVVGSRAMSLIWPRVGAWVQWRAGQTTEEDFRQLDAKLQEETHTTTSPMSLDQPETYESILAAAWRRVGDASLAFTQTLDKKRLQEPRLAQAQRMASDTRLSLSLLLAEQAQTIPHAPFFFWEDRAYSYAEANGRIHQVVAALTRQGVRRGEHVGVWMRDHPDTLTLITALGRLGAVAVILPAKPRWDQVLTQAKIKTLVMDEVHLSDDHPTNLRRLSMGRHRETLPEGITALEGLLRVEDNLGMDGLDQGLADELALILYREGPGDTVRLVRITHGRWVTAALSTAALCHLSPQDTVYCTLSLRDPTALMVAVGGAVAGGSRLAMAPSVHPQRFWPAVRRSGASVVFHTEALCCALLEAPMVSGETQHPVRLFAGRGLPEEVQMALLERFGAFQIASFYGSTDGNLALVNMNTDKAGCLGKPLLGEDDVALLCHDETTGALSRDKQGRWQVAAPGQEGVLISRVHDGHMLARYYGTLEQAPNKQPKNKILKGVFTEEDRWFVTGDLVRRDQDGDYWLIRRLDL